MSKDHDQEPYAEIAEAILDHAQSISRLDGDMGAAAYQAALSSHVRAMRLLAVAHMDPQPDRQFVRQLRTLSGNAAGVFVHMIDGAIELVIDAASKQQKIKLWNRRQLLKNEEEA